MTDTMESEFAGLLLFWRYPFGGKITVTTSYQADITTITTLWMSVYQDLVSKAFQLHFINLKALRRSFPISGTEL